MKRYANFKPTEFDGHIRGDLDHLLVAPVMRNRDSDHVTVSNWEVVSNAVLSASSHEETDTHQFNHWLCGWFEILLIHPEDTSAIEVAEEWERKLEGYPVADEDDLSSREFEDYLESWDFYGREDFIRSLVRELNLEDPVKELLSDIDSGELREFFESLVSSGEYYTPDGSGVSVNIDGVKVDRLKLRDFLRARQEHDLPVLVFDLDEDWTYQVYVPDDMEISVTVWEKDSDVFEGDLSAFNQFLTKEGTD